MSCKVRERVTILAAITAGDDMEKLIQLTVVCKRLAGGLRAMSHCPHNHLGKGQEHIVSVMPHGADGAVR